MPKKGVRVVITGKPRPVIDIDAMTQIVIALGREFDARAKLAPEPVQIEVASS
jgi:hypothetical protein